MPIQLRTFVSVKKKRTYTRNKDYCVAFGKNVRKLRKAKGISSQQKLADLSDLELSQINRIELGLINTSISHVEAIAEALGEHPKVLMDFEWKRKKKSN